MRTGAAHACGRWHYTEWVGGDVELFDLARDPWELRNLARTRSALVRRFHLELRALGHGRAPAGPACAELAEAQGARADAHGASERAVDSGVRARG